MALRRCVLGISARGFSQQLTRRSLRFPKTPSVMSPVTYTRRYHVEGVFQAPLVFGGLLLTLWTWKCFMMVIFQNKIIYMPGLPPYARRERIQDYANKCGGLQWREERTRASDWTDLALCVTDLDLGKMKPSEPPDVAFYILYFQGNASSIPPRLPDLSSTLRILKTRMLQEQASVRCTVVCLSYRGYWTSRGRPTENGLRLDAAAALDWISQMHKNPDHDTSRRDTKPSAQLILYGQSIGCGVATNLAAEYSMPKNVQLNSLILETPFTSIRAMLEVLYPQKWVPYKHLWPFLRNQLDTWGNLGTVATKYEQSSPSIFILQAAKDELVPAVLSQKIYNRCINLRLSVTNKSVAGAFHNDALFKAEGKQAISEFLKQRITTLFRRT